MNCTRTIVLPIVSLNGFLNIYLLFRIVSGWVRLVGDAESEWEGGGQYLARSFSAMAVAYLLLATTATMIGLHGVYKRLVPSVRLYLQFSFGDLVACSLAFISLVFNCYHSKQWKDNLCEGLSTQPDILRVLHMAGYDIENCESWIEQLVFWSLSMLAVGLVVKLQFTLAVVSHYISLAKSSGESSSIFTTVDAHIQLPTRKPSRSGLRDRHHSTSKTQDLPPYSDSPPHTKFNLFSGQRAASAYELDVFSSSSGLSSSEEYAKAKRREPKFQD